MAPIGHLALERRSAIGNDLTQTATIELILPLVATVAVALRIGLRKHSKIAFGWDDLLIVLCLPFIWGLWGVNYWCMSGSTICDRPFRADIILVSSEVVKTTTSQLLPEGFPEFLKVCLQMS